MQNDRNGNNSDKTSVAENIKNSDSSDSINLDDLASHLKSLEQKLAAQPEIDQEHVDRIRSAISSGEFRIDPESVASKMMNSEDDF